jgi:hypothetical protein
MSEIQPATSPNPPKLINDCLWLWCEEGVCFTRCCAMHMSAELAPSSCKQGCCGCAHQLSERSYAPRPCTYAHKPLETNKNVVRELCTRWRSCPIGLQVNWPSPVGPWYAHISRCRSHSKTCSQCFHASRTSFPPPRNLLQDGYGVFNQGRLHAGKFRVWKQRANVHQGMSVLCSW